MFFGSEDETNGARRVRERFAKAVCAECSVRQPCLDAGREEEGIWGGLTRSERVGRSRTKRTLERPTVGIGGDANPWVILDTNGAVALWQRDSELNWHGSEWAVAEDGVIVQIFDDLNLSYLKFGSLVQSEARRNTAG